jgi:alpha-L-rhamnosidase
MHCGDYLPKSNGRQWCLSDWLSPEEVRVDTRYFNSVVYFLSVKGLNAFHEILYGKPSEELTCLAEKIREAINKEYFDKEHYRYAKGEQGETAFALWAGIFSKEDERGLKESLRRHYTEVTNGHFDTGIVLTPILLEYLTDNGMRDLALRLMMQTDYPSFAYLLEGETTIAEHWSKRWISRY